MITRGIVKLLLQSRAIDLLRRSHGPQLTSSDSSRTPLRRTSSFRLTGEPTTDAVDLSSPAEGSPRSPSGVSFRSSAADTLGRELTKLGSICKRSMEMTTADTDDLHSIGQKPITFLRQVVALATHPALLNSPAFPDDAKARAARIVNSCYGNSIGSYTEGLGIDVIRNDVADYILRRDGGIECDVDDIFLSNGATDAITSVLTLLATEREYPNQAGIMVPFPGYPVIKDIIRGINSCPIPYYLEESSGWDITINELQRAIESAREHCLPRAIVVINPSNPTGHVLSERNIEHVIRFAQRENLVIVADEVFQQSVFGSGVEFHSFKKVLVGLGDPYENMELASIMSVSKGITAEGGFRSGFCEFINLDAEIRNHLIKFIAKTCSPVSGQIAVDVLVKPPVYGDPSYTQFQQESGEILSRLRLQAATVSRALNSLEGISCVEAAAATFLFPRIQLPPKATEDAKDHGLQPDEFYCRRLLEETGISVKPGKEFGQKDGHHHFRLTLLPSLVQMETLLEKLVDFHQQFTSFYRSDPSH